MSTDAWSETAEQRQSFRSVAEPTAPPAAAEKPLAARRGQRLRMLFPHVGLSSFIRQDLETLRTRHEVRLVSCESPWRMLLSPLRVPWADCVFCWFGSLRFLPLCLAARLLGRRVVVIAGGYDVADVPEIGYGNMRRGPTRWLGRLLFRLADLVISYSHSGDAEVRDHARVPPERRQMLYLGFDPEDNGKQRLQAKEDLVLTVAIIDEFTIRRKRLLDVAHTSRLVPDVRFVLAGPYQPEALAQIKEVAGPNLECPGYVSDEELRNLYARAKVYYQPSVHEAFGCAVAEAMLYNCVPVVTRRYSLPEVVGESGYYVEAGDREGMAAAVRRALIGPPSHVESPRERIARKFPASRRADELLSLMEQFAP